MNRLTLNAAAFVRLGAQLKLNGTFNHTLRNDQHISMAATVEVEQCHAAVYVRINIGRSRNSITLDRNSKTAASRLARYIESIANGEPVPMGVAELDEYLLASDTEVMLRTAIRQGRGTHYLPVEGLDVAVLIGKTSSGRLLAAIEAEDVTLQVMLPRNPPEAYATLAENVERFIGGHRAAQAA